MRFISGWKKALAIFIIAEVLIISADISVAFLFGSQLKSSAAWLFSGNTKETFGTLLFIEGALLLGVGATLASGSAENKMASPSGPSASIMVEEISKRRGEAREKQISAGLMIMLVGVPLIVIPIALMI